GRCEEKKGLSLSAQAFVSRIPLEVQLQPKLQLPWEEGAARLTEATCGHAIIRRSVRTGQLEVGAVEQIERFSTELQAHAFCELEVLKQGHIHAEVVRTQEGVATFISYATRARPGEERGSRPRQTIAREGERSAPAVGPHIMTRINML